MDHLPQTSEINGCECLIKRETGAVTKLEASEMLYVRMGNPKQVHSLFFVNADYKGGEKSSSLLHMTLNVAFLVCSYWGHQIFHAQMIFHSLT